MNSVDVDAKSDGLSLSWEAVAVSLGAVSGLSLILSIIYDMGYFDTIGLRFSDVPTGISDHVRSALLWVPRIVVAALVYTLLELGIRRFGGIATEHDPAGAHARAATGRSLTRWVNRLFVVSAFLVVIANALTGGQLDKYASFGTFIVVVYVVAASYPYMAGRVPSPKLLALCLVPVVTILIYNLGVMAAREEQAAPRRALITLNGQPDAQVSVYRYLDRGVLASTGEGRLVFFRWEDVKRLSAEFQPPKRVNWLCKLVSLSCSAVAPQQNSPPATRKP